MFAKPFEALAETCEAGNPVFDMNMPLLLLFSLIGATVGGKPHLLVENYCFCFSLKLICYLM